MMRGDGEWGKKKAAAAWELAAAWKRARIIFLCD
jgi:hypothetical protein